MNFLFQPESASACLFRVSVIESRVRIIPTLTIMLKTQSETVKAFCEMTYHITNVQYGNKTNIVVKSPGLYPLFFNWNTIVC